MKSSSTIASPKISRPRLHGVVARERLFQKIGDANAPIVWISGLPGAGKTTLAASYLDARTLPGIWYSIDSGDTDPATFFYYLGLAVGHRAVGKRRPLPLLPAEARVDLAVFARRYFRDLFERLTPSTVLVLDNFQDAGGESFETIAREAFSQVPDGITIIVLSLSDPPSRLARLVANRAIALLDPEELRFTRDESRLMLSSHVTLDETSLTALCDRSGGWAAGIVLMAEYAHRLGHQSDVATGPSEEAVFDYFAGEIFAHTTPEHRRILMLTAMLPRITAPLAEAVAESRDAAALLDHLYGRHLFVHRRPGLEPVYQYHALFRAFLRARALECLSTDERAEAANRAAQILELNGDAEDAVTVYLECAAWPDAARLIVQYAGQFYEHGRWRTLRDWIASVPGYMLDAAPWLAYWSGACQVWVDPQVARRQLQQAFDQFVALGDRTGQVLTAAAMTRAWILDPDWTALDKWIAVLEGLLPSETDVLSPQTRLTGFSRLLYATFVRQPQHPQLRDWAERTQAAIGPEVECNEAVHAASSLMMYYYTIGDTSKQEHLARQLRPLLASPGVGTVGLAYWKWTYSTYVLRVGQPRDALAAIDEALELAEGNGLAIAGVIRRYRVGYLLALGDLPTAEAEIRRLENAPSIEPYYELKSWLALQRGNLALAQFEAQIALQTATDRGRAHYRALDLFLLAVISAQAGDFDKAKAQIDEYRHHTIGVAGRLGEYQALLVDAYIALQQRDRATCHALLRVALDIGRQQRYRSHWIWFPTMMARLYAEALDDGIEVGYVQDVIKQHGLLPGSPDTENWPWRVKIHALGRFEVLKDGELLRFEGKAQRQPIKLAKVLIALGGRNVPSNKLIDLLWSDPSAGDAQKAFEITVHRLRRLLDCDEALQVSDRSVSLNPQFVWVDVWALDRRLASASPAAHAALPDPGLLESEAAQVLSLYRGHFLAGEIEESWQIALKNSLSARFGRFVLRLGEHWEAHGQWRRATELYHRAIELDPLGETFYRRQMVCLHAQGQRAEAIETFRRCRQMLSVMLGVPPTDETEAVYRQLLQP